MHTTPRRAFGLAHRGPLEKLLSGHDHAVQRADDGIEGEHRLVEQEDHPNERLACGVDDVVRDGVRKRLRVAGTRSAEHGARQHGNEEHDAERGGDPRRHEWMDQPAGKAQRDERWREEAATQVVGELPNIERREVVATEQGQHLPVPSHPSVASPGVDLVRRGLSVENLDVARKRAASEDALKKVVAEKSSLGNPAAQRGRKRVHIVDAFTDERPLPEEVLVHVGHCRRVGVDTALGSGDARVASLRRELTGNGADARLNDAVTAHDAPSLSADARAIERMRERADQPPRDVARQLGVGIQRDDIPDGA